MGMERHFKHMEMKASETILGFIGEKYGKIMKVMGTFPESHEFIAASSFWRENSKMNFRVSFVNRNS